MTSIQKKKVATLACFAKRRHEFLFGGKNKSKKFRDMPRFSRYL
jgi:hypothetical protein